MLEFIQKNLDTILSIAGMILAWLVARPWAQSKLAQADLFIQQKNLTTVRHIALGVVQRLYQDSVRAMKEKGKFGEEEKRMIFNSACDLVKAEIKEHGVEIAQSLVPGIVEWAVQYLKSAGLGAKLPAPFLPGASAVSVSVQPQEAGPEIPGLL